jgi:thiol-disulfide isomerase/thioredoxin
MTMRPFFLRKGSRGLLLLLPLLLFLLLPTPQPGWTNRGALVIFSANWCASCRDVLPIVKELAQQNNLTLTQIDVDSADAPKQARNIGLSIPTEEPPQVFCLSHGRASLVYNGKAYRTGGGADSVRTTLLQNLQQILPR